MVRALSLRQPWADAVVFGQKRIENRTAWTSSTFRGAFLIHAAQGMTKREYEDVLMFLELRKIDWRPKPFEELHRGGIVGIASVEGVVYPDVDRQQRDWTGTTGARVVGSPAAAAQFTLQRDQWWMGAFALLLADVRATPFVPMKGALGFFRVPDEIARMALGVAA